jgi:AbiJ N-terminal domain 4
MANMPVVDLYSTRNAKDPDVWVYDQVPPTLRVQVSNLVRDALGGSYHDQYHPYDSAGIYDLIRSHVAHERGVDKLAGQTTARADVETAIRLGGTDLWIDVVEYSFRAIETFCSRFSQHDRYMRDIKIAAADAVTELNERFRRAGVGYRFEQGKIVRLDNEVLHQTATVPALKLLSDPRFSGADEEFRAAHDHLKAGEFKDCTVDALNALESTMKAICDAKGWEYDKGARASDLIKILKTNGLFPDFADLSFDQLIATLKSGLPVVRNETGGHGQGTKPIEVPEYVAVYALNLAASKIRLLFGAFKESEKA